MLLKERQISIRIRKLEALLRRLPKTHPTYSDLEVELAKNLAGYRGEQSMNYYYSYLMDNKYCIFHDLRLFDQQHYFQMDTLLLCPSFILIVEVKNFIGTLFFDSNFKQLIRTHNGKEEAFPNPLIQAKNHQRKLSDWLEVNKLPSLPIESLVVISNPQAIIRTSPNYKEAFQKVTTSQNFLDKLVLIEATYKTERLTGKEIKKISKMLLSKHAEGNPDLLRQFSINKDDLLLGVYCPSCSRIPMNRIETKWFCTFCNAYSSDAHIHSLSDYLLLFETTITNRKLREFLRIESRNIATYLLSSMNLPTTGKGKGTTYHLSSTQLDYLDPPKH
ncbi:nuclease-related domain-containing protein [Bacillus pinisoli]|uniref:nuclease-related domain-containing protein n=1 Tax=Bacillus pinisoli TaxID=2901866 RepID=UPI001FF5D5E3|nr:nuclease-related domain-containing protein [Bacillus pinisoli]